MDGENSKPAQPERAKNEYPSFSFGAFFFNWIFALVHRQWLLAALCFFTSSIAIFFLTLLIDSSPRLVEINLIIPYSVVVFTHFILMVYLGFNEYNIAEKCGRYNDKETLMANMKNWNSLGSFFTTMVLVVICLMWWVFLSDKHSMMNKARYNRCLQALSGLKVAEEMYINDNNKYVGRKSVERLGMYMVPGCTNEKGCGSVVSERMLKNCKDFEIKILKDGFDYQITGTATDRTNCCICVNSKGGYPEKYIDCPSCPAKCPK